MHDSSGIECDDRLWDSVFASPSIFGRLLAVARLRDPGSGRYEHSLAKELGAGVVDATLRRMHREIFDQWLNLNLERQERDLSIWLSRTGSEGDSAGLLPKISRRLGELLPAQHLEAERRLFMTDFQMLMVLIGPRSEWTTQPTALPSKTSRFAWLFR